MSLSLPVLNPSSVLWMVGLVTLLSCRSHPMPGPEDATTEERRLMGQLRAPAGWDLLFNGRDLEGWHMSTRDSNYRGTMEDIFKVEHGLLHVYPQQPDQSTQTFAGLITETSYSHFHLTLEYRWGEKKFKPRDEFVRDAGVIFHVHGEDQIWPNGVEMQIQEGDSGDLWAIGTRVSSRVQPVIRNYSPNGRMETMGHPQQRFHRFHRSYCWELVGWNKLELIVRGDQALFILNGKQVNEAIDILFLDQETQTYQPLTAGKILLQAEGAELYYRNIFIREIADERYVIEAVSEYDGLQEKGFVKPYIDKRRKAIAINAAQFKGEFAAATYTFLGETGSYDVKLRALAELDGESQYRIAVNGQEVKEVKRNPMIFGTGLPDYTPVTHTWKKLSLSKGDRIRVAASSETNGKIPEGQTTAYARGRFTQLIFEKN